MPDGETQVEAGKTEESVSRETNDVSPEQKEDKSGSEAVEREPGGAEGEDVYQRKLYRENKDLKATLREQELEKARLEERLKVIQEKPKEKAEEKIYSRAQLRAGVANGAITQEWADQYEEQVLLPHLFEQWSEQKREKERPQELIKKAKAEIAEYGQHLNWLTDRQSPEFKKAAVEFARLRDELGLPDDSRTELLALQSVAGPLTQLRRQKEVANLTGRETGTHAEIGSGGGKRESGDGKDFLSKVPSSLVADWEKIGVSKDKLQAYAKDWLDKQAHRRARFG